MVVFNVLLKCCSVLADFAASITLITCDLVHISHVIGQEHLVFEFLSTCVTTMIFLGLVEYLHMFLQPYERFAANGAKVFSYTILMFLCHVLIQFPLGRE